ncbi:unnamed protein product [Arctogadus glacialis]
MPAPLSTRPCVPPPQPAARCGDTSRVCGGLTTQQMLLSSAPANSVSRGPGELAVGCRVAGRHSDHTAVDQGRRGKPPIDSTTLLIAKRAAWEEKPRPERAAWEEKPQSERATWEEKPQRGPPGRRSPREGRLGGEAPERAAWEEKPRPERDAWEEKPQPERAAWEEKPRPERAAWEEKPQRGPPGRRSPGQRGPPGRRSPREGRLGGEAPERAAWEEKPQRGPSGRRSPREGRLGGEAPERAAWEEKPQPERAAWEEKPQRGPPGRRSPSQRGPPGRRSRPVPHGEDPRGGPPLPAAADTVHNDPPGAPGDYSHYRIIC